MPPGKALEAAHSVENTGRYTCLAGVEGVGMESHGAAGVW